MATAYTLARTSDPLSSLERENFISRSELSSIVIWLLGQLNAWEFAKISQGGHTQTEVPLRRVFVDLPVSVRIGSDSDNDERLLFLDQFLKAKPVNLKRAKLIAKTAERNHEFKGDTFNRSEHRITLGYHSKHDFSASILIGGPGQGKSTLGQLACQLHRAALLKPFESRFKTADKEVVKSFELESGYGAVDTLNIKAIKHKLFPLQISLPELASWISANSVSSTKRNLPIILQFLAALTSSKESSIAAETLSVIVTKLPVLVVLDGFDEVGATEDREKLIVAANELISFISNQNGYAQILATTRPQGYMGEFARLGVSLSQCYLVPLQKNEALNYAERLLVEKISNPDDREKILSRIREAADEPATERLLTTPLQVTILSALVQHRGRAPRERWNLFSGYFSYTYAREAERETYASALLRDFRIHIEQIHARVALILQVEAERDGGAAARMPRERLKEIVSAVLMEAGYEDDERKQLVKDIAKAAEERLVFLVEPEPGNFGFEIRSFQEFLSAWAITSGPEKFVLDRLAAIARAPMFRNVILFAFSRLFSDGSYLRDRVISEVLPHLDRASDDIPAALTKSGALLALETLEEGAALSYPRWAKQLMLVAAELLQLPPSVEHRRLGRAGNNEIRKVLYDLIEDVVLNTETSKVNILSIWVIVIEAANKNEEWAVSIGERLWPQIDDFQAFFTTLKVLNIGLGEWLRKKIFLSSETISPNLFIGLRPVKKDLRVPSDWVALLCDAFDSDRHWRLANIYIDAAKISSQSTQNHFAISSLGELPRKWEAWGQAALFEYVPSSKTLSAALNALSLDDYDALDGVEWRSSWPLRSCIRASGNKFDLARIGFAANQGKLGDYEDWKHAEQNWKPTNFKIDLQMEDDSLPFTIDSIQTTPPIWVMSWWQLNETASSVRHVELMRQLNVSFISTKSDHLKEWSARAALYLYRTVTRDRAVKGLNPTQWIEFQPDMVGMFIPRPPHMPERLLLEMLDCASHKSTYPFPTSLRSVIALIASGNHYPILFKLASHSIVTEIKNQLSEKDRKSLTDALISVPDDQRSVNVLLLEAYLGVLNFKDDPKLVNSAFESDNAEYYLDLMVETVGSGISGISVQRRATILAAVLKKSSDDLLSARCIQQLRNLYQRHKSTLIIPEVWDALALSLPRPFSPNFLQKGNFSDEVVTLNEINIVDICGIKKLKLSPNIVDSSKGQWIVLLGENGAGKTSILRSICLALRNSDDRGVWPRNSLSLEWLRVLDSGESVDQGSVSIKLFDGGETSTVIRGGLSRTFIRESNSDIKKLQVFAYGCRRGSALGGVRRQVDLSLSDGPEIATLFDDSAELIHAETWLISMHSAAAQNESIKDLLHTILDALARILNLKKIEIIDQQVLVSEVVGPTLPLSALSDGYLTNAGWFLDLLARWIELARRTDQELRKDFLLKMTGVVLIDEIDLHLHPKWQVEIIKRTRSILPSMTFLVTTHNPMTLVGARAEEIWVLERTADELTLIQGVDRPILLTGGEIYQEYFGMPDVYPSELGEKLRRYNFLSRFAMRSENEDDELDKIIRDLETVGMLPEGKVVTREVNLL